MANLKKSKKTNSVNASNPHIAGEYTIEDKRNVIKKIRNKFLRIKILITKKTLGVK